MNCSLFAGGMNGALIGLTEYMRSWSKQWWVQEWSYGFPVWEWQVCVVQVKLTGSLLLTTWIHIIVRFFNCWHFFMWRLSHLNLAGLHEQRLCIMELLALPFGGHFNRVTLYVSQLPRVGALLIGFYSQQQKSLNISSYKSARLQIQCLSAQ